MFGFYIKPHTALVTKKLLDLGWEVLPYPPYSPDLAPTDYHLFRALDLRLRQKIFRNDDEVETWLTAFFDTQPVEFYRNGIESLPRRWRKVIDSDGKYFDE